MIHKFTSLVLGFVAQFKLKASSKEKIDSFENRLDPVKLNRKITFPIK